MSDQRGRNDGSPHLSELLPMPGNTRAGWGAGAACEEEPKQKPNALAAPVISKDARFARVIAIIQAARGHIARSVNATMLQAYRLIAREIVEVEQCGERVIDGLSGDRSARTLALPNLRNMQQLFLTYREGPALFKSLTGPTYRDGRNRA
jgi:hypothetical protein